MTTLMLVLFAVLMVAGMPIGYALVVSASAAILVAGEIPSTVVLLKIFQPTQSFPLLAIPFFILSGSLLMSGELGQRLVGFAASLVGRFRGGLGQVNVFGSALFGGVSGSAVADASALGSILIPWMKKEGYPPALAGAITASSSIIAVLIPPSIPLILFAAVSNASIAELFLAGILPGVLLTLGLMAACWFVGWRRALPTVDVAGGLRGMISALPKALPAIALPLMILGLLRFGIATPTEVSVLAVVYALLVRFILYRDLSLRRLSSDIAATVAMTGVVMLVIAASNLVAFVLTVEDVPNTLAAWALNTLKEPWLIILMMNVVMIVVGMFLDLPAAILLLGPIFVALAGAIGLDLIQLGLMMTVNLAIGLFTPPVGTTLFIASAISRQGIGAVAREMWPFYLVSLVLLGLISYVPALTIHF
jgi:tripartite ATP-independent transporter DctM subunit